MPAFFDFDGTSYHPSDHCIGPWSAESQHFGPPAALIARAIAAHEPDAAVRIARLTIEVLRPVPMRPLTLTTANVTSGRIAQRVAASLWDGPKEIARALALRLRAEPLSLPPAGAHVDSLHFDDVPRPPDDLERLAPLPFGLTPTGYHTAVEMRMERGTIGRGPVRVWLRPLVDLVAGEPLTPLESALVCGDSGNGVSQVFPTRSFSFVNADLDVHFQRAPTGTWMCLDARTLIGSDGIGLAETRLWDTAGHFGRGAQMLVVRPFA